MMNSIIVLVGKAASGKTTLANMMIDNLRYDKVVTYTTRPMRPGEVDGVDYHFVSDKEFLKMKIAGEFIEEQEYKTNEGIWRYGLSKKELYKYDDSVLIVEANGMKKLHDMNLPIISFYIDMDDRERLKRQIDRGDDIIEIALREVRDATAFYDIECYVDYVVTNNDSIEDLYGTVLEKINAHNRMVD